MFGNFARGGRVNCSWFSDRDDVRHARIDERIWEMQGEEVVCPDVLNVERTLDRQECVYGGGGLSLILQPYQRHGVATDQEDVSDRWINSSGERAWRDGGKLGRINR